MRRTVSEARFEERKQPEVLAGYGDIRSARTRAIVALVSTNGDLLLVEKWLGSPRRTLIRNVKWRIFLRRVSLGVNRGGEI